MEDSAIQLKALREVGDLGRNAIYEIALPVSTVGGTWRLSFAGQVTAPIAAGADKSAVRLALEALSSVGVGDFEVMGVPGGPFRLMASGALGGQALPPDLYPFTADGSTLTPAASLVVTQTEVGQSPVMTAAASAAYIEYAGIANERLRFLHLKRDLIDLLLGGSYTLVDASARDREEKLSQQFENLRRLRAIVESEIGGLISPGGAAGASLSSAPISGKIGRTTPNGLPYGTLGRTDSGRLV